MILFYLLSDQLYNWSDKYEENDCPVAIEAHHASKTAFRVEVSLTSRLSHRTLQALREAGLQMCGGQGPRAEVLRFCEQAGKPPRDGLRFPGTRTKSPSLSRKLSTTQRCARRDLGYQSRTSPTQRGLLALTDDSNNSRHRYSDSRRFSGQHDSSLASSLSFSKSRHRGGET